MHCSARRISHLATGKIAASCDPFDMIPCLKYFDELSKKHETPGVLETTAGWRDATMYVFNSSQSKRSVLNDFSEQQLCDHGFWTQAK